MTESQCLEADWYVVGVRDGTLGRPADYVERHREACTSTGIVPDVNEYRTGRRSGLDQYCTTRSGLAMGRLGEYYENVCPETLEPDFLRGYEMGREIYDVSSDIDWSRMQLRMVEEALEASEDMSKKERKEAHEYRQTLKDDLAKLNKKLDRLERDAARTLR